MDDLMKEEAKKENFVLKDYFEFIVEDNPEDEKDLLIQVDVKPLGQTIIDKKKTLDSNFNEEEYFQNLIRRALSNYVSSLEEEENVDV